ncbi:MAG: hypothetical protein Q8L97_06465 [Nitrosomonas sp.]|nr:hypothetical protein [Nitrosomonas sp.]MDP1549788.1 hypothetical protein [Nitrosomonas sp.]
MVQSLCPIDIFLLPALSAAAEQDDECVTILGKVNTLTRPPVDDVFANAVKPFHAGCISKRQTQFGSNNFGGSLWIKVVKSCLVWV